MIRLSDLVPTVATPIQLSWAAGVFEGEGTVTIGGGGKRKYTRIFVCVANTDFDLIAELNQIWPMKKIVHRPAPTVNAREYWIWRLDGLRSVQFMEDIRPYVVTARVKEKMDLAIRAQASKRQGSRDLEYYKQQKDFMIQMRKLNLRGNKKLLLSGSGEN